MMVELFRYFHLWQMSVVTAQVFSDTSSSLCFSPVEERSGCKPVVQQLNYIVKWLFFLKKRGHAEFD